MKKILILGILALAWKPVVAQFTTGTGCEYTSNPQVGIGLSSCPNYNLVVNPSSSSFGAQVLLGGTSFISNTASFASDVTALELQAPGDAILNLASHYTGSDYDNIWLGTDIDHHYIHCFGGGSAGTKSLVVLMRDISSADVEAMRFEPSGWVSVGGVAAADMFDNFTVGGDIGLYKSNANDFRNIYGRTSQGGIGIYANDAINNGAVIALGGDNESTMPGGIRFSAANSGGPTDKAFNFAVDNPTGNVLTLYKDGNVVVPAALTVGASTTMNLMVDQTKLAVNGLIACNELKVIPAGSVWPDYVFAKDYNRMSLPDVANYIEKNKHLPQFASACEIENKGFNVGETQTKLLEAVEELYLHVIDLKKENEELKKEITALKK